MNLKELEHIPILIECPICKDTTIAKDFKTLDETIHKIWQLSKDWMNEFFGEQNTNQAIATAGIMNNREKLLETFAEQGFLKIMCKSCMTTFSIEEYKKVGLYSVRINNWIFETNFYRKNRKFIEAKIKANPDVFKKTFWT